MHSCELMRMSFLTPLLPVYIAEAMVTQSLCREQKLLYERMFIDVIVDGFRLGTLADLARTL
jgi:hypothetical protein